MTLARTRWFTALLLAVAFPAGGAFAQDDPDAQARALVAQIQKDLARIDEILLKADADPAAAAAGMEEVREELDELLRQARDSQLQVCENIEELVRLTKYSQSQQSGGGQDQPPPDPSSGEQPRNRERGRDPEVEELKYQGEPKPNEGQAPQPQPQPQGEGKPEEGKPDPSPGENRTGKERPPSETGTHEREDVSGRWGNLPPKAQEAVPQAAFERMPEKYRRIIEEYYRTQSEKERE